MYAQLMKRTRKQGQSVANLRRNLSTANVGPAVTTKGVPVPVPFNARKACLRRSLNKVDIRGSLYYVNQDPQQGERLIEKPKA